ncbi:MAG: 3-phosphoserine/phosphohydroxythreonine transaminase [Bacteroidota bacterium]
MTKIHNFSAGPAILPQSVMKEAGAACVNFQDMGLSILEISHRSPQFSAVLEEAEALVRELLNVGDDYGVLFLQGGASSQFFMAPMNLLGTNDTAAYIETGTWATKAIKEAKKFGQVANVASSKEDNFTHIPKEFELPDSCKYLHITSNNTVRGTQYAEIPNVAMPLVCDASSDIFSRPMDVSKFDIIYAGAQKNMGPAGVTLVIARKDALGKIERDIPTMLDYRTHIEKGSAFNTPPVFPIYVSMLNLRWVKENGGVAAMEKHNAEKARLMYQAIDESPLFSCPNADEDRSTMSAVFVMNKPELEADFLAACKAANCSGVKGHRSVGGFRASMYNAMNVDSVEVLTGVMREFTAKHA